MKKYKTSEVIAMLEGNPKLRFKNQEKLDDVNANEIGFINGALNWISPNGKAFNGFTIRLERKDEWTLVQQPISFMEAVKAYAEGKTIRCEISGETYTYSKTFDGEDMYCEMLSNESHAGISANEILYGVWYIEEE